MQDTHMFVMVNTLPVLDFNLHWTRAWCKFQRNYSICKNASGMWILLNQLSYGCIMHKMHQKPYVINRIRIQTEYYLISVATTSKYTHTHIILNIPSVIYNNLSETPQSSISFWYRNWMQINIVLFVHMKNNGFSPKDAIRQNSNRAFAIAAVQFICIKLTMCEWVHRKHISTTIRQPRHRHTSVRHQSEHTCTRHTLRKVCRRNVYMNITRIFAHKL